MTPKGAMQVWRIAGLDRPVLALRTPAKNQQGVGCTERGVGLSKVHGCLIENRPVKFHALKLTKKDSRPGGIKVQSVPKRDTTRYLTRTKYPPFENNQIKSK